MTIKNIDSNSSASGASSRASNNDFDTFVLIVSSAEDTTIDASQMEFQDIENLRGEDAFAYHSIVQHQRRCKLAFHDEDSDKEEEDSHPMISSAAMAIRKLVLEDIEDKDEKFTLGVPSVPDSKNQVPPTGCRQQRRRSQSFNLNIAPSEPRRPQRQARRFTQSFSGFTTGVVTRQRRVTTECHSSLILSDPDLLASLRESISTDIACMNTVFDDDDLCDLGDDELDGIFGD